MIKLVNLSKYYYGNNSVALGLRKVNLEFHKGEFVAITGESGSGKTTLLSVLSGLLPYEDGEMFFNGNATSYYDEADWEEYRKNHIAFVFQNYNLIDSYTALENVMTSFLIQGVEKDVAIEKSKKLLDRVGILEYATHRATELSSGQKQRLAIARALAKNTEVIVADEPTGNLDAENGRQIMELFAELAKEKLVICVTHNYEEAAPFVTRKIVIHDAEVEEDIQLRSGNLRETEESKTVDSKTVESNRAVIEKIQDAQEKVIEDAKIAALAQEKKSPHYEALQFALMNIRSRIGKSVFLTAFMAVAIFAYFLFFGNFLANLDDTNTKLYENSAFFNSDKTRIVVRHADGSPMTEADFAFLQSLEHASYVDKYSLVNDMNYFTERGVDYQVTFLDDRESINDPPKYREEVSLSKFDKYIFSASGLSNEDLAYGRLPQGTNEVVLYTEDASLLNTTMVIYFQNRRDWSVNAYIRMEMTVCSILKEPTEQMYFSDAFCEVLNTQAKGYKDYYALSSRDSLKFTHFYVDETLGLEGNHVALHKDIYKRSLETYYFEFGILDINGKDWFQSLTIRPEPLAPPVASMEHQSSMQFIAVSSELYKQLYGEQELTQMGLYIDDYAYMNDTLREIRQNGYEAVAPFHIGSVSYDDAKVTERLVTIGLSLVAMLVLFALEIIILIAFMRNERGGDLILKSIGMAQKTLSKVKAMVLFAYSVIGFVVASILFFGAAALVPQIHALVIYYRFYHIAFVFVLGMLVVLATTWIYKKYLTKLLRAGSEVLV